MALIASLITGHGETEHITSFDVRAYNRAMFGGGKYILQDEDNLKTQVSALTGTIQISKGSCLWSGMHIRVEEEGSLSYTSPASTNYVYVWLHYVRNPENLVESVEFVTTTGTKPETNLIFDNLTEEATEAYTLFCSFTHDTSSNSVVGLTSDFSARHPLDDTAKSLTSSFGALQTNVSNKLQEVSDEVDETVERHNQRIEEISEQVDAAPAMVKNDLSDSVYLGTSKTDGWIVFSESLLNFTFVVIGITCKTYTKVMMLPRGYISTHIPLSAALQAGSNLYAVTFNLKQREGAIAGKQYSVENYSAYSHSDSVIGGYTQTEIPKSDVSVFAYGIGRIQEG